MIYPGRAVGFRPVAFALDRGVMGARSGFHCLLCSRFDPSFDICHPVTSSGDSDDVIF